MVLVQERQAARSDGDRALLDAAAERVTGMRRKSGLDANAVTLLYTGDIASAGSPLVQGLDNALRDRALSFYQSQTRRLKRSLTRLPPASSPQLSAAQVGLRCRLLFKIAHYQEFRSRPHKVLKYYSQSYNALQQCLSVIVSSAGGGDRGAADALLLQQAKAAAEMISFKIMHGYLQHGNGPVTTPSGLTGLTGAQAATMQFQNHVRAFEHAVGAASSAAPLPGCAHYDWLCRQYIIAAELLQLNLPRPGLDSRPQHVPSYFYHTAALYAVKRRKAAEAAGLLLPFTAPAGWSSGGGNAAAAAASTPGLGESARQSQVKAAQWSKSQGLYIGGRPRLAPIDGSNGAAGDEDAALLAVAMAEESAFAHSDHVVSLVEKAQQMAIIDGGSAAPVPASATTLPDASDSAAPSVPLGPGSSFAYHLAADNSSRGRVWRQWMAAEEMLCQGKIEQGARLLAAVGAVFRKEQWRPLLARVALRLRDCAVALRDRQLYVSCCVDLLELSLHTSVPRVDDICSHLAAAVRDSTSSGQQLLHPIPAPPPLLFPDPTSMPLSQSLSTMLSTTVPPLPAHCDASMRQAGAPLLAATVLLGHRIATRGGTIPVRVIISSNLPRPVTLDRVDVRFACIGGDPVVKCEAGRNSSGTSSSGGASASAFDVSIVRTGSAAASATASHAVAAPEADKDGIARVDLTCRQTSSSSPAASAAAIITSPLVVPAQGSIAIEYTCRAPLHDRLGSASDGISLLKAMVTTAAAAVSALPSVGSTPSSSSPSSPAGNVDGLCTNPVAMASLLAGQGTPQHHSLHAADHSDLDTIVCEAVDITWAGVESISSTSGGAAVDGGGSAGLVFRMTPRLINDHAGADKAPSISPSSPLGTSSTIATAYLGHQLQSSRRDPSAWLSRSMEGCVAHMARIGGSGSTVGDHAYAPGSGGAGWAEGTETSGVVKAAAAGDLVAQAPDDVLAAARAGHTRLSSVGTINRAKLPPSSAQQVEHLVEGHTVGRSGHFHNSTVLQPPPPSCYIDVAEHSSGSAAASSAPHVHAVLGAKSRFNVRVGNTGASTIAGGVLMLRTLAPPTAAAASVHAAASSGATPMADVEIASATTTVAATASAAAAPAPGDASLAVMQRVSEAASRGCAILVPVGCLVVTADGRTTTAGHSSTATAQPPSASDGVSDLMDVFEGTKQTPVVSPATTGGWVAISCAASGVGGSNIVGLAVPQLPAGCEYICPVVLQFPKLTEADAAHLLASPSVVPLVSLSSSLYVGRSISGKESTDWLATAAADHSIIVTSATRTAVNLRMPVTTVCTLHPDVSSPVMDTTPLMRTAPLVAVSLPRDPLLGGSVPPMIMEASPSSGSAASVRAGSRFTTRLAISAGGAGSLATITGAKLVRPTSSAAIRLISGDVAAQVIGDHGLDASASAAAIGRLLGGAAAAALAKSQPSAVTAGRQIDGSTPIEAVLAWESDLGAQSGQESLGIIELQVSTGSAAAGTASLQLVTVPLPSVAVVDSSVRCDMTYPAFAWIGQPVQLGVSLVNRSAHFHALEVGLQQFPTGSTSASSSEVPASFDVLDRYTRYVVELLPGASKAISFNIVSHRAGFTLLPLIAIKATRTEGKAAAQTQGGAPSQQQQQQVAELLAILPCGLQASVAQPRGIHVQVTA